MVRAPYSPPNWMTQTRLFRVGALITLPISWPIATMVMCLEVAARERGRFSPIREVALALGLGITGCGATAMWLALTRRTQRRWVFGSLLLGYIASVGAGLAASRAVVAMYSRFVGALPTGPTLYDPGMGSLIFLGAFWALVAAGPDAMLVLSSEGDAPRPSYARVDRQLGYLGTWGTLMVAGAILRDASHTAHPELLAVDIVVGIVAAAAVCTARIRTWNRARWVRRVRDGLVPTWSIEAATAADLALPRVDDAGEVGVLIHVGSSGGHPFRQAEHAERVALVSLRR